MIRSLRNDDDDDGNENGEKSNRFYQQITTSHVRQPFFVHFFAVVARLQRENA